MQRGNLDDLAIFCRIARSGSFTRAAAELETSTSNISHAMKQLELRLGYRLLQRTSRSVSLTEDGSRLLATLEPALHSIEEALETTNASRELITGTLRITATREGYETVIRPALKTFAEAHPQATVEVMIDFGLRDIVADRFDAGVRLGEKLEQDMVAIKLGPDARMAVVATPEYLARHGTPTEPVALVAHRCINYRMKASGSLYAWEFERDGQSFEVRVTGPLTINEPEPMVDAALCGLGIAYLSEQKVASLIAEGRLIRLLEGWTPPFRGFYLYHSSKRQVRPILASFITTVRRAIAQQDHDFPRSQASAL